MKKTLIFLLLSLFFIFSQSYCLFDSNEIADEARFSSFKDSNPLLLTSLYTASLIALTFPSFYTASLFQAANEFGVYAIFAGSFILLTSPWILMRTPSIQKPDLMMNDDELKLFWKYYKDFVYFNRIISILIPVSAIALLSVTPFF
ncbi:TPA: hypothetical protein DCW38_08165 [candidate division WOR-3 bacterium]|jgi:hypothetical protein|uniref:Uncharacterized protein n=1 Tax=candidate division WOR-3 bacterium TaxID=2052148 RepID=A0A350HC69_UNCW3|nr:hypothetical protein [candidate division WOR-3 bacterium]